MTKGVTVRARMSSKRQVILVTSSLLKIQLKRMFVRILNGPVKSNPVARSKIKSDNTRQHKQSNNYNSKSYDICFIVTLQNYVSLNAKFDLCHCDSHSILNS